MLANIQFCRALVVNWNQCHGAFFRLRESDLLWHLEKQDWLEYFSGEAAGVPILFAQATENGARAGISRKTIWISLHGEIPAGAETDFLAALDKLALHQGKTRLAIGGEDFHLVPGIPDQSPLVGPAQDTGFRLSDAADFAGSLRTESVSEYVLRAQELAAQEGWQLSEAVSEEQLNELGDFLAKEFPGRWEREFRFWRQYAIQGGAFWNLFRKKSGAIAGFARLAKREQLPGLWVPGALRFPLAADGGDKFTDSCLGPIGIAAAGRGSGAGKILLGLSLQLLLVKSAERVCIDWTNAYNYYKPLGLPAVRKYWSAVKDY